jgi:hypothetical protein
MKTFFAALLLLAVPISACTVTSEDDDGDVGDLEESTQEIKEGCAIRRAQILGSTSAARRTAIARGFTWLDANVPYSQSRNFKGYRTDCSGFVSMSWELGTSYTTATFSSGGGASHSIGDYGNLRPADALVRRSGGSGHIVLFLGWNDAQKRGACVLEQASTASDMQFRVRTTASLKSGGYKAIRANKLRNDTGASAPAGTGGGVADEPDDTDDADLPAQPVGGNTGGTACSGDGACNPGSDGAGLICVAGRCTPGCRSDAQCPGATRCSAGQCR